MTIHQLEAILKVSETASVNKAAQALFLSQPALTKAIHSAENELGKKLFIRSRRGMELTEFGQMFCRVARDICQNYSYMKRLTIEEIEWQYPSLRVSSVPIRFAGEAFSRVVGKHSTAVAELRYVSTNSSGCVNSIINQESDIAVISICDNIRESIIDELSRVGIAYMPLHAFEPVITVTRDEPIAQQGKDNVQLCEISGMQLFSLHEEMPIFEQMNTRIIELLGLSGDKNSVSYERRAGLTDIVRQGEFRCNLDSGSVYETNGIKLRLADYTRVFHIAPSPPFYFEMGVIRLRNGESNPLVAEYIQSLTDMVKQKDKQEASAFHHFT